MIYMEIGQNGTIDQWVHTRLLSPVPSWVTNTFEDTDTDAMDAIGDAKHYTYLNGTWTYTPPTSAELIQQAAAAQIAQLQAAYDATINAGFQFTIGTTAYIMGWREDATHHDQLHLSQVQQAIDKGVEVFPVDYADSNGNTFSIPDQTTLTALDTKATSFGWAQVKQLRSLVGQVQSLVSQSGTTVADIQAVVWTPASY